MILPVTFHNDTKSTGQSRSAPPAEFRTLLHSVKTPTAHWVFLAVLLGTNTFEISAISSSESGFQTSLCIASSFSESESPGPP